MDLEVIPAILAKDKDTLIRRILLVKDLVKFVQIDVMDGNFVPNTTVGLEVLEHLPKGVTYELHWMVQDPLIWVSAVPGPHIHLVHIETIHSSNEFDAIEESVKEAGGKLGLAINPDTPIEKLIKFLPRVSEVLVMTVHPGFSGQKYIDMSAKIKKLRELNPNLDIEVDGGINLETIGHAYASGANILVAASAIFSSSDVKSAIEELRRRAVAGASV